MHLGNRFGFTKRENIYNLRFMNIIDLKLCSYVIGCEFNKGGI